MYTVHKWIYTYIYVYKHICTHINLCMYKFEQNEILQRFLGALCIEICNMVLAGYQNEEKLSINQI